MMKRAPRMTWAALATGVILTGAGGALAGQDTGRYQLERTQDGFIRLDTATGSVSHCQQQKNVWTCSSFDKDGDRMRREMEALKAENRELRQRLTTLENQREHDRADKLELPDEQQFEEMMGFLERTIRRFRNFARSLQDVPGQDI